MCGCEAQRQKWTLPRQAADLQRKSIAHYLQIIKIMSPAAGEGVTQPEVVFEKQIAVLLAKYLKAANGGDTLRKLH